MAARIGTVHYDVDVVLTGEARRAVAVQLAVDLYAGQRIGTDTVVAQAKTIEKYLKEG